MAIYKTRWFDRWARKEGLGDTRLVAAIDEMSRGLVDAFLGSGLVKKRIGRPGHGKSGSFRTLVATNQGDRWMFVFGFPKNERDNIEPDEVEALKKLAIHLLSLSAEDVDTAQRAGELVEVQGDAQDEIPHP
ncbi:type II toxin-antitoxin system RelE/ParE family toxin [Leptothrix discophora]|uniref:Type II toxin-antitoxin system RelE/ParE family toxin n=1 Tax=Leptothrix discophora TaxID=89 RepID=A0ABT9G6R4_LEPDI|nr:type II toxin-antitoxin system RelE/ParE family toxin [Leptothrix discophora]MDP4301878.1 type II toxin-antitoxin system RelE/ParE family toxin [Leptothrix discophora]